METLAQTVSRLPHSPGVYLYRDINGKIIYVGKAKDLKKRVSQYFQRDDALGVKTSVLVGQIHSVETINTASEFDALILEAKLIHEYKPKYNSVLKDDKTPLYILLTTGESLPHVSTIRKSDISQKVHSHDSLFGPFQSAHTVRMLLRHIRRSIPYCIQKQRTGKPCFYTHLGLCSPCPSDISRMPDGAEKKSQTTAYRGNIFRLKSILSGKSSVVLRGLEKEMKYYAKKQQFEQAAVIRDHITNLYTMLKKQYDPNLYIQSDAAVEEIYKIELQRLRSVLLPFFPDLHELHRIECMDISNTSGNQATGSLVVLSEGRKDTNEYRRFHIRLKQAPNDFAMIAEVVERRFSHPEWSKPDLLVIDGGKGQLGAAESSLRTFGSDVPVIGLAKRFEEIIIHDRQKVWKAIRLPLTSPAIHVLERIRDESHRFAITYHRKLRASAFV